MLCPADLTPSTHFLRFVQSSECEWIAVLRVTRGTHQFSLDFLSKWLEMSCSQKEPRVRIPNSPPKTQSYQGFCPYDWAFLFSQGHIGVHDFGKNSGVPAVLPCVRQSQDIVHYICRGDLGLVIQFTDLTAVASPNRRKYFRQIAGLS